MSNREEIKNTIESLPTLSRRAFDWIFDNRHPEDGFSDTTWDEVANGIDAISSQISGVATKLVEAKLVWVDRTDVNGTPYDFVHIEAEVVEVAESLRDGSDEAEARDAFPSAQDAEIVNLRTQIAELRAQLAEVRREANRERWARQTLQNAVETVAKDSRDAEAVRVSFRALATAEKKIGK